jgi:hypothetical protein
LGDVPTIPDIALPEWDLTIERARQGGHAEDKLMQTAQLLSAAIQRTRLRGDRPLTGELTRRLEWVHQLLDQV